jgi:hypothetical protein
MNTEFNYENQPTEVKEILDRYAQEENTYTVLESLRAELNAIGYDLEYDLNAEIVSIDKMETQESQPDYDDMEADVQTVLEKASSAIYDSKKYGDAGAEEEGESFERVSNIMSASPDMLKALKRLVEDADDRGELRDDSGELYDDWAMAIEAIEKAEGRNS